MKSKEIYVEASLCFLPASHEKSHEHIFLSMTKQKASGGDENPAELFQILEDDAVKLLHLIGQRIWKIQQWPQAWKRSVFIPIPKGNAKECSNYCIIASFHMLTRLCPKSFKLGFRSMWTRCRIWVSKRQRYQRSIKLRTFIRS